MPRQIIVNIRVTDDRLDRGTEHQAAGKSTVTIIGVVPPNLSVMAYGTPKPLGDHKNHNRDDHHHKPRIGDDGVEDSVCKNA